MSTRLESAQEPTLETPVVVKQSHSTTGRPRILLVVPRGEAVRNFLYSDTLPVLAENADVTLLSVIDDRDFRGRFEPLTSEIIKLERFRERKIVASWRALLHAAHFRWLWSEVAKNLWERKDVGATTFRAKIRRIAWKVAVRALANRPTLEVLGPVERYLTWKLRPTGFFEELFSRIRPDLVFNCSHIHGLAGELPMEVARRMGIPTVGFIFSWDNLTSRSRIFVQYDHLLVWNSSLRDQLLRIYPRMGRERVKVTGTPQFDFHFHSKYWLDRKDLCAKIGVDPTRPFVLYTTGMDRHFPEEHRTVRLVADLLGRYPAESRLQLVVRTYAKGTSAEMKALAREGLPDVVFPPIEWDEKWLMPYYEDQFIYTNLLRHCALGINAASTVSLELMMHDKPIINLGFDPPGSRLPHGVRYMRHIEYDHYRPVAKSGAVMVAKSAADMAWMLEDALSRPERLTKERRDFVQTMFENTLDGESGRRVAEALLTLARSSVAK